MSFSYPYTRPLGPSGESISAKQIGQAVKLALPGLEFVTSHEGTVCAFVFDLELSEGDETILTNSVSAFVATSERKYEPIHMLTIYSKNKVIKIEYFQTENEDGTFSGLANRRTRIWQGRRLIGEKFEEFFDDGTVASTEEFEFRTTSQGQVKKKVQ